MERLIDGVNRNVTLLNKVVKYSVVENVQTLPLEELSTIYCRSTFFLPKTNIVPNEMVPNSRSRLVDANIHE